jgi:hypothetical protein
MEFLGEVRLSPVRSKSTRVFPKASRKTLQGDHGRDCRIDDLVARKKSNNPEGRVTNPALRDYRIPAFADLPRSEVFFADTYDKIGPRLAHSLNEH